MMVNNCSARAYCAFTRVSRYFRKSRTARATSELSPQYVCNEKFNLSVSVALRTSTATYHGICEQQEQILFEQVPRVVFALFYLRSDHAQIDGCRDDFVVRWKQAFHWTLSQGTRRNNDGMGRFVVQQQLEDFIENQGQLCQLSVATLIVDQLPVETASLGEMRTTDVVVEEIEQF